MNMMNLSMQAQTQDLIRENTSAVNAAGQNISSLNNKVDSIRNSLRW